MSGWEFLRLTTNYFSSIKKKKKAAEVKTNMLNACLNLFVWLLVALDPLPSVPSACHLSVCFMRLTQT